MGLFDWIGRKKREEKWMAEPRRLPYGMENYEPGDPNWIMSHEFASNENKNLRFYMAAHRANPNRDTWAISMYKYDLKHESLTPDVNSWETDYTGNPLDVVRTLADFDRKYRRDEKYVPVDGHRGTYRFFANQYGIHFDDEGNIFKVKEDTRIAKGTFMNRESLDALFHKNAAKTPEIDTWEEIYSQLIGKWPESWTVTEQKLVPAKVLDAAPEASGKKEADAENAPASAETASPETKPPVAEEQPAPEPKFETVTITRPVTLEDLSKHPDYARFAQEAQELHKKLEKLPADLRAAGTRKQKEQLVESLAEKRFKASGDAQAAEARLAQRLLDGVLVVGLLRAGADLYEDFAKGKFSADTMGLMSALGKAASAVTQNRLGADEKSAAKIPDIIAKGKDPNGDAHPLARIFIQFPPAERKPAAPAVKGPGLDN